VRPRRDRGLLVIAWFKLLKALLLATAGLAALKLMQPGAERAVSDWVQALPVNVERRLAHRFLARLTGLSDRQLEALGVGFFAYASLFVVEGVGLWRQKRWAEYLTLVATSTLIPVEVYELARQVTAPRVAVLLGNVLVVVYLAWALRRGRRRSH